VIGKREDIPRLVEENDVGIIIFAIHNIEEAHRSSLLEICHETSARVVVVPDILGYLNNLVHEQGPREGYDGFDPIKDSYEEGSISIASTDEKSSVDMDHYLEKLEHLVEEGDLVSVSKFIQSMRDELDQRTSGNGLKRTLKT
jgi:hypothetical protein